MPLRPFTLTFFEYQDGDPLGWLCALLSCAPIFAVVGVSTLIASRRDLATISLFLGQLLNEALNAVLKRALRQPRPPSHLRHSANDYGMPSAHAQFCFFLAVYLALWAYRHWHVGSAWRGLVVVAFVCGGVAVTYSRVYLKYHSVSQVLAGVTCGAACGAAWFAFVEAWLRPRFPTLARSRLGRALWLRDCTHVHTLLVEYCAVADTGKKK
jgi:dolichyldiphosphatase